MRIPLATTICKTKLLTTSLATCTALAVGNPSVMAAEENRSSRSVNALLEEVVVKARKKAAGEAVQDTPIAMSAFGEAQFKAVFADTLSDIGLLSPNVELKPASQVGSQNFTIRGMGVSGTTPSDSPAVGVFQNGVFWGSNYGSLLDTFDIESVEILRGPQGTLFGRNVTGGAVSVRTKRPDQDFGFGTEVVYGSYGRKDISAAVEGSIAESKLAARLTVLDRNLEGYFDNLADGGSDFGENDSLTVRGTLVYTPSDKMDIALILDSYDQEGNSVPAVGIEVPGTLPDAEGFDQPEDFYDIFLDNPGTSDIEVDSAVVEANWDIGGGLITSITGYRSVSQVNNTDFDGTASSGFNQSVDYDSEQVSQEIRYASTFSERYEFTVGLYYFDLEHDYAEGRDLSNSALLFATANKLDQQSWALFGEVDFNLSDSLTFTLGARYTEEKVEASSAPFGACTLNPAITVPSLQIRDLDIPCAFGEPDDESWNSVSPKVGLNWLIGEDQMAYVSVVQGARSGGFTLRGNPLFSPFDEESVTAYEVGYKSDLMDGRLRFNLAAFRNEYDDLQRTILGVDPVFGVVQATFNAAEATVKGIEMDVVLQATDNLMVTFAYGFTDATYDKFDGGDPDADFERVPENSLSGSVVYNLPLANSGDLSFRVAGVYTGSQFFDLNNTIEEPAYTLWDASVTWFNPSDQWQVSVFGKNLGGEEYAYWGSTLGALGANRFAGAPRTGGVRVTYQY